jgi:leucyl/phenylalanyl-tRNA--protein transferase
LQLTPALLLSGYAQGIFPMAESQHDTTLHWVDPSQRGIMPLDSFHISRSLSAKIRARTFTIRTNTAFEQIVDGCADRPVTWINAELRDLYLRLHAAGHAHSVEVWNGSDLAGGVFGVSLGAAFFGESMFSRETDASKIALAYLVDRLVRGGFLLFDTQFLTSHLQSLGGTEIPRAEYRVRLAAALKENADFNRPTPASPDQVLSQRRTQTS